MTQAQRSPRAIPGELSILRLGQHVEVIVRWTGNLAFRGEVVHLLEPGPGLAQQELDTLFARSRALHASRSMTASYAEPWKPSKYARVIVRDRIGRCGTFKRPQFAFLPGSTKEER